MSEVYRAKDTKIGRDLATKRLPGQGVRRFRTPRWGAL